jgi:succinate dehydrogenase / fumarate reductase cytochrome b subunit
MKKQQKNLNLMTINFPMPAIVSILHRMSGVIIFLLLPAILISMISLWPIKLLGMLLVWGLCHHFIAGCRHLLLDMQIGNDLIVARFTSKTVLTISFLITFLVFIL